MTELSKDITQCHSHGTTTGYINIEEVTTDWRCVLKEQNKPSIFSNHGVKVSKINQNRINTFYVLLDLPEKYLFNHEIERFH